MENSVRRLAPADAAAFQRARLRALDDHPTSFASSVPQERDHSLEFVASRLDPASENATFGVFDGDQIVGTAGIARESWPKLHHRCEIWGVWVAPSHRGKGLARQLMQACIDHAWQLDGVRCVVLGVNVKNASAITLYRSMGFEIIGTDPCFMVVDGEVQGEHQMILMHNGQSINRVADIELLRNAVATIAYRGGKAVRGASESFANYRPSPTSRTPLEILAHMGDLFDWAHSMIRGEQHWHDSVPLAWTQEIDRFHAAIKRFDDALSSTSALPVKPQKLMQGPIADAMWHAGQIAYLRRMAGEKISGENYSVAQIEIGRVGKDQAPPRKEFE